MLNTHLQNQFKFEESNLNQRNKSVQDLLKIIETDKKHTMPDINQITNELNNNNLNKNQNVFYINSTGIKHSIDEILYDTTTDKKYLKGFQFFIDMIKRKNINNKKDFTKTLKFQK